MARIRTVKPEIWTDEAFVEMSMAARLLYLGVANFADDAGIFPASAKTIKMQVLPGDEVTIREVEGYLAEMEAVGLIFRYEAEGRFWFKIASWENDQRVDRPNYKYPKPNFGEQSANNRRTIGEQSANNPRTDGEPSPPEGKGREGKGKEGREGGENPPAHEREEISKNQNWTDAMATMQNWSKANSNEVVKWIAAVSYETETYGPAYHQIAKFASHFASREEMLANPVGFFQDRFPSWLSNAKNFDRAKREKPAQDRAASPPTAKQAPPSPVGVGEPSARAWLAVNAPTLATDPNKVKQYAACQNGAEMAAMLSQSGPPPTAKAAKIVSLGETLGAIAMAQ